MRIEERKEAIREILVDTMKTLQRRRIYGATNIELALSFLDKLTPDATADEMIRWMRRERAIYNRPITSYGLGYEGCCQHFLNRFDKPIPISDYWTQYLRFAKEMSHG